MAFKIGDSEEICVMSRIRANAYHEAMEAGDIFINWKCALK